MLLDLWPAILEGEVEDFVVAIPAKEIPGARLRSVLRYRLVLTAGGAFEFAAPDPVVIRAATTLTPLVARAHTTTTTRLAIDDDAHLAYRTIRHWTVERVDTLTTYDPDEWIVLDDPTLS